MPRFVFVDFPLGNPCGRPFDPVMQRAIVELGLDLLADATAPRPTVVAPFAWADDAWKARVFTTEQPFLDGEDKERWLARKEEYRRLKATGEV